jgi:SAM-dependent methyltransferase
MLEAHQEPIEAVARALRATFDELAACVDLRPGPRVDAAFGRLVRVVLDVPPDVAPAILAHRAVAPVVGELRALCFAGEYELELEWACRIATSPRPRDELERFPYIANYRLLAELERSTVTLLAGTSPVGPGSRVAVIGSGPLPLTSFLLAAGGARVDNVERDGDALDRSRHVAAALGVDGLAFHQVDVGSGGGGVDLATYDLVVLAALVGLAPGRKAAVLRHLAAAMAPGALLLARSARGLRTLLYPEVAADALAGFEVLGTVHPTGEVINSVILARKPRRPPAAKER